MNFHQQNQLNMLMAKYGKSHIMKLSLASHARTAPQHCTFRSISRNCSSDKERFLDV